MKKWLWSILIFILVFPSCKESPNGCDYEQHPINELQFIGSHNSYRLKTYQPIFDFVQGLGGILPPDLHPDAWDYTHLPMTDQLDYYHLRSFEIDIYPDPDGGRFYYRHGNSFVGEDTDSGIPELLEPGYKVLHIPDVDYMTHYITFKEALDELKAWSVENPTHEPLFVMLELKVTTVDDYLPGQGFAPSIPYTAQDVEDLESEIKSVFGEELTGIYTPDRLRGSRTTLKNAVTKDGWPTLGEARGQIFLIMSGSGDAINFYKDGRPNFEGRAMFAFAEPDEDGAAFAIRNNPEGGQDDIRALVEEGYMVRTRADADTQEARSGDTARRDAAFDSGAQLISTDYYLPDPRHTSSDDWSDYSVRFTPSGAFRKNVVNNELECDL
jgi:hypothetical protein